MYYRHPKNVYHLILKGKAKGNENIHQQQTREPEQGRIFYRYEFQEASKRTKLHQSRMPVQV